MGVININVRIPFWVLLCSLVLVICFLFFTHVPIGSNFALAIQSSSTFLGALLGAGIAGYFTLKTSQMRFEDNEKVNKEKRTRFVLKKLDIYLTFFSEIKKHYALSQSGLKALERKLLRIKATTEQYKSELFDLYYGIDNYHLEVGVESLLEETYALSKNIIEDIDEVIDAIDFDEDFNRIASNELKTFNETIRLAEQKALGVIYYKDLYFFD